MDERVEGREAASGVRIGILGGTGALGRGLAVRLAAAGHLVTIGSRDRSRAAALAETLAAGVVGAGNDEACDGDLVVVTVPWSAHASTLRSLSDVIGDRIVVDCVNPIDFDKRGPYALVVDEGSACEQAQQLLPRARVVGAFHHVSAPLLLKPETRLDTDVMVVGDDDAAVDQVISVIGSVDGLRGVYAGRLRVAHQVEALTANLIAINRRYRVHSGLRISGWDERPHS